MISKIKMQIKIMAEGGNMTPNPALSQQLGPAGVNIGQVISKVNEATKEFKGLKVPVELDVNTTTKKFEVKVFSPPVSELLKKEFKVPKGSGDQKKLSVANASIEQIISVAKVKMPGMLAKDLKSAVKSVIGTCGALGILIENKYASEIEKDIASGKYDSEIKAGKSTPSPEKLKQLEEFFSSLHRKQEKAIQDAAAAKEAEAEAKAGEKAVATGTAPVTSTATESAAKPAAKAAAKPAGKSPAGKK